MSDKIEMKKKLAKEMADYRIAMEELKSKERERLSLSFQWEKERRLLETKILNELNLLKKKTESNNKMRLREYLDYQCVCFKFNIKLLKDKTFRLLYVVIVYEYSHLLHSHCYVFQF